MDRETNTAIETPITFEEEHTTIATHRPSRQSQNIRELIAKLRTLLMYAVVAAILVTSIKVALTPDRSDNSDNTSNFQQLINLLKVAGTAALQQTPWNATQRQTAN